MACFTKITHTKLYRANPSFHSVFHKDQKQKGKENAHEETMDLKFCLQKLNAIEFFLLFKVLPADVTSCTLEIESVFYNGYLPLLPTKANSPLRGRKH